MRAFVINLATQPDRLASVTTHLRAEGVEFTRVEAVDGRLANRRDPDVSPWARHFATDSMLGCALSHVRLWRRVRRAALIMEDDVRLVPGFRTKLRNAMAEVPDDWDIFLLGYFELVAHDGPCAPLTRARRVSRRVFVPALAAGFHCYMVSAKGARKLAHTRAGFHIDVQVAAMRGLNIYAAIPPLATQVDMSSSSMASLDFPRTVNCALSRVNGPHGISLAYYANVPVCQLGFVKINAWVLAFLVMGLARTPWVLWVCVVEAAAGPSPALRDCLVAYCLGYWLSKKYTPCT